MSSDDPSTPNTETNGSAHIESEEDSDNPEDLQGLIRELRAELTRLKAHQAKARAKNWIQRHPLLTMVLSAGVGAAAGYGAAMATRPRPPRTLSEHARQRLREVTDDARRAASRLRKQVGDRAARSGAEFRRRAEDTGRQLAEDAQHAGDTARREAQDFAKSASERLQKATSEAGKRLRERGGKAAADAQEWGEKATEAVEKQLDEVAGSVSEAAASKNGRTFTRAVLSVAGIAAGGYLASKLRQWM